MQAHHVHFTYDGTPAMPEMALILYAETPHDALDAAVYLLGIEREYLVCMPPVESVPSDERLRTAIRDADEWWFHEAHGLHDTDHHLAHGGLVACVPLLTRTPELLAERESPLVW